MNLQIGSTATSSSSIQEDAELVDVDPTELSTALSQGFDQATGEKVVRLLGILRELQARGSTVDRFTLKGGTALNVFHFPEVPRLSVDLDLMATGFPGASPRTVERREVVLTLRELVEALGYGVEDEPEEAGVALTCTYRNGLGSPDRVKIDLDLLNRMTLLPPIPRAAPALFGGDDLKFPVVSEPELLGQKLTAVAYRAAPRDLFDMHIMLRAGWHRKVGARAMYLAYSFLQDEEWYRLAYPVRLRVPYRPTQLRDVLRGEEPAPSLERIRQVAKDTLEGSNPSFSSATEREEGLRRKLLKGDVTAFADLIEEEDEARRAALAKHPGLAWRLQQAARHETRNRSR
jgi:predicted nucleotidyltransferase component of viral defense system